MTTCAKCGAENVAAMPSAAPAAYQVRRRRGCRRRGRARSPAVRGRGRRGRRITAAPPAPGPGDPRRRPVPGRAHPSACPSPRPDHPPAPAGASARPGDVSASRAASIAGGPGQAASRPTTVAPDVATAGGPAGEALPPAGSTARLGVPGRTGAGVVDWPARARPFAAGPLPAVARASADRRRPRCSPVAAAPAAPRRREGARPTEQPPSGASASDARAETSAGPTAPRTRPPRAVAGGRRPPAPSGRPSASR
jgi:hypothetical protein